MKLTKATADVYVPDGTPVDAALARTTHLAVGAHQDDLEIMALEGILAGFGRKDVWFTGVILTDGAGSPRDSLYASYTDDDMKRVRRVEQMKAAFVGEYAAAIFLDHPSSAAKDPANPDTVGDLLEVLRATQPDTVYTHNLADKHPTHVSTALRVIAAARKLPPDQRPKRVIGCEVWRDLDWMADSDKVVFKLDKHENIAASLVGVFDSQIVGGKRYDLATMGRRRAHATYLESHAVDVAQMVNFGMDLTPLLHDTDMEPISLVDAHIERFASEIRSNLKKLS